jgi:hypothetical protein
MASFRIAGRQVAFDGGQPARRFGGPADVDDRPDGDRFGGRQPAPNVNRDHAAFDPLVRGIADAAQRMQRRA